MSIDLRYPIGKFSTPAEFTLTNLKEFIARIEAVPSTLTEVVKGLSPQQLDTPYRPEGWTVRQVVHHLADSHMNAYIRFHWTLTEDSPKIKAYDEKKWAELPYQTDLPVEVSISLLRYLHERWAHLLRSLTSEDFDKWYTHPQDGKTYELKKVVALYAWHGDHHIAHITSLKERMNWQ